MTESNVTAEASFDPVGFIMAVEDGEVPADEYVLGMAWLIRSGVVQGLQGSWQRAAIALIQRGVVSPDGEVDFDRLDDILGED